MKLVEVLQGVDGDFSNANAGVEITGVTADSRNVGPGMLFAAIRGRNADGHSFIDQAISKGAAAILCERTSDIPAEGTAMLVVPDSALAYGIAAGNFVGRPAEQLVMVAVTGTNGKTTITYLVEQVLLAAGHGVGVIGTVNNRYCLPGGEPVLLPARYTTPEAMELQLLLREMVDAGVSHVIMEVSSHALAQARLGAIRYDLAAFTNLSRDHLDYHLDMEEYFQAKSLLFSHHLKTSAQAVLPRRLAGEQGQWGERLQLICSERKLNTVTWSAETEAHFQLLVSKFSLAGTEMQVRTPEGVCQLGSQLVGRFNTENILTALAITSSLGVEVPLSCQILSQTNGAPGRLERVRGNADLVMEEEPVVLVDYAHTPDALEQILATVVELPHRHLYCVFGCGGDRDQGKRPVMAAIAAKYADCAIITDDNPRTEDPDFIVRQMVAGLPEGSLPVQDPSWLSSRAETERGVVIIRSRREAISAAIRAAGQGDIVVIAGKGHEDYQITLAGKQFFDDRLVARSVLLSWTIEQLADATGGRLQVGSDYQGARLLGGVTTDSRLVPPKGIFVALRGENHDAHDFAAQAVSNGASCLVVERVLDFAGCNRVVQLVVKDCLRALGDLASWRRQMIGGLTKAPVVGLTGSCGKTTVKEMVAAILARVWPAGPLHPKDAVLKTTGNYNNLVGLPLSLLPFDLHHRAAVLEAGMNQPGELERLGAIADPDISCILNVYGAHLAGLASLDGVAKAKEELFAASGPEARLIINLDDPRVARLAAKYGQQKITFASEAGSHDPLPDFYASSVQLHSEGGTSFTLHHHGQQVEVHLFVPGEHNVMNALAAASIAGAAGADLQQTAAGLADFRAPDKRMQLITTKKGYTIINDTYNANPASMAAGLRTMKQLGKRTTVAIIGEMLELGDSATQAHYDVGALVAELSPNFCMTVGEHAADVGRGALAGGYRQERLIVLQDREEALERLPGVISSCDLGPGDVVFVKASRGLRFETMIARLQEND